MMSQELSEVFTTKIRCQLYEPMIGKVAYGNEVGIPEATDPETCAEMGWKYTVCGPLSPYALGWENWRKLIDIAGDRALSEVFHAEVDFERRTISVFKLEVN